MQVSLLGKELSIGHLDHFGDLGALFQIGNYSRLEENKSSITMAQYLALQATDEFIKTVSSEINEPAIRTKRGKGGSTSAHLYILLDAAAHLSPKLKLEMYKIFVEGKLLQWRDMSGDKFIDLNLRLSLTADDVLGKPSHHGHYTTLAKIIKSRILPEGHAGWNYTSHDALSERTRIETFLSEALKNGLVRDWEHLKELAGKV